MNEGHAGSRGTARSRGRGRRSTRWLGVATAVVVIAAGAGRAEPAPAGGEPGRSVPAVVAASLPVWNLAQGSSIIRTHAADLTAASPNLYEVAPDGMIAVRQQPTGVVAPVELDSLRRRGIPLIPTISNTQGGSWAPQHVQAILHDPDLVRAHVQAVVELARTQGFAGVDIDYEELVAADRDAFSAFIRQLAEALHAEDRVLTVDLFAKDSDRGYDERNLAQDYAAIGAAADEVRLMAYDWHWQTSVPGPIAPVDWVGRVLAYAVHQIPAHKVVLGVPTYGYGWGPQGGELVSWLQVYALSQRLAEPVQWDQTAQSPWLRYRTPDGGERTVWFENAFSVQAKLQVAQDYGIGGIYLWLVGDEDDALWAMVAAYGAGDDVAEVGLG